jgi:hypothetical protein
VNIYPNGQGVVLSNTFKNTAGALTDPTTVTLTVRRPDGTVDTPTAVKDSTGTYHADYTSTTQAGAYVWRWSGTGALIADSEGTFMVLPAYA